MRYQDIVDRRLLKLCSQIAQTSNDPSTKTGAIITSPDGVILAAGWNRFPTGMKETPERMANRDDKYSRIVHCEINALLRTGRLGHHGCTLYTTPFMSCDRCVVIMLEAGIRHFVTYAPSADKVERWGPAFEKTRSYIAECGGELVEYADTDSDGGTTTQREEHNRSQADGHFQSADSEERRYKTSDAWAPLRSYSRTLRAGDRAGDD